MRLDVLTDRKREVMKIVALGLSNKGSCAVGR